MFPAASSTIIASSSAGGARGGEEPHGPRMSRGSVPKIFCAHRKWGITLIADGAVGGWRGCATLRVMQGRPGVPRAACTRGSKCHWPADSWEPPGYDGARQFGHVRLGALATCPPPSACRHVPPLLAQASSPGSPGQPARICVVWAPLRPCDSAGLMRDTVAEIVAGAWLDGVIRAETESVKTQYLCAYATLSHCI